MIYAFEHHPTGETLYFETKENAIEAAQKQNVYKVIIYGWDVKDEEEDQIITHYNLKYTTIDGAFNDLFKLQQQK